MNAVVASGPGTWSFPTLLTHRADRVRKLHLLIRDLDATDTPARRASRARAPVLAGPWLAPTLLRDAATTWVATAPLTAGATYPVALDAVQSLATILEDPLLTAVREALAPSWTDLVEFGLADPATSRPRWDDIHGDDADMIGQHLVAAAARAVAGAGTEFGVLFRGPEWYDHTSIEFVRRVAIEATTTGLHLAFETADPAALAPYRDVLAGPLTWVEPNERPPTGGGDATLYLVLSPHGIPELVLRGLGVGGSDEPRCLGPDGTEWAFLPRVEARLRRRTMSKSQRRLLLQELFDAWPTSGWDYLRRGAYAQRCADRERLLAQHTPYVYGVADIGPLFAYRQCRILAQRAEAAAAVNKAYRDAALYAAVGAARLATRVPGLGYSTADRLYKRALRHAEAPAVRADLEYALGTLHARRRTPHALEEARTWYEAGAAALAAIPDDVDRAYVQIRLLNCQALAVYHADDGAGANALERHAARIAERVRHTFPEIFQWAMSILNANVARLLETTFGDIETARTRLRSNLDANEPGHRVHARLELARLDFDQRDFPALLNTLGPLLEPRAPELMTSEQELFARLLFGLALAAHGDTDAVRGQLARLRALLRTVGNTSSLGLLQTLEERAALMIKPAAN